MASDAPKERPEPGSPIRITAVEWNRIAAAIEDLSSLTPAPPLARVGKRLHDLTPRKFAALLSGASSPYSWTEQVRVGSAWVAGGRAGTSSAVEVNAVAGLGGSLQWISPCGPGEWCFQDVKVGAGCSAIFHVTVIDQAYAPLAGATVVATKTGSTTVSGTSDGSGLVDLTVGAAGTWTITGTKTGYSGRIVSANAVCGDTTNVTLQLIATTLMCGCDVPQVLAMTNNNPGCNSGMFQPCTIRYGPTPAALSTLALGTSCFLSDESFIDVFGDRFRYYLNCTGTTISGSEYTLTRVYVTSIFGSPFRDSVRYTWPMSTAGNSCSPFALINGILYAGGTGPCTPHVVEADLSPSPAPVQGPPADAPATPPDPPSPPPGPVEPPAP